MRVLILTHTDCVPPEGAAKVPADENDPPWVTEHNVYEGLKKLGHDVRLLGVIKDLTKIRSAIEEFKPKIVFNLLEEFLGEAVFDQNVVSYLELLRMPYTGCNPRGLILTRDKALSKKILAYHRIRSPKFMVFPRNRVAKRPKDLQFPLIVKCLNEEASLGIAKASVVHNDQKLQERVDYIREQFGADAIAEQFIEGRELYVGVMGNYRLKTLPVWELRFTKAENPYRELYSERAKFNQKYRMRHGIKTGAAKLDSELQRRIEKICRRSFRALSLNGYARLDLRVDKHGEVYLLEVNPNPDIAREDEFAESAASRKLSYGQLLQRILKLGLQWNPTGGS